MEQSKTYRGKLEYGEQPSYLSNCLHQVVRAPRDCLVVLGEARLVLYFPREITLLSLLLTQLVDDE